MNISNLKYDKTGSGEHLILLHGWGSNRHIWDDLEHHLSPKYQVWKIDLPGFGETPEPHKPYTVLDYSELLRKFIEEKKIDNPLILGHSFGGRVAIKYASKYKCQKLILVDSAGIKRKSIKKTYLVMIYKIMKKFNINKPMGSKDFQKATPLMKRTLSLVVNEDLKKDLKKIDTTTLLIWGNNDQETPPKDGYVMEKLIPNSGLVLIPKAGHFPFLENKSYFYLVLDSFLASDEK